MKRSIIIATFGVLLCTNLFSQNLKIGDFEMPVTKAEKFYIGGNFNLNSNDSISIYKGALDLNYSKFYSSLPYSYFLNAFLFSDLNHFSVRNDNVYIPFDSSKNHSVKIIKPTVIFDYQRYFSDESKLHLNVNTNTNIEYKSFFDVIEFYYFNGLFEIGLGYGRIIDATSLAKALRIQEFLINDKQLLSEMGKEIVMEVAQHCDKLYQYEIDFGEKFQEEWFLDLEKIMMKSGKLTTGNLNPFSVLRVMEVLYAETIWYRPVGWSLNSNFAYRTHGIINNDLILHLYGTSINLNFGYPITNNLHFYHNTNYLYLIETEYNETDYYLSSQTSLSYNLTNLFNLRLYYNYLSQKYFYYSEQETQELNLKASYYLENNVSISLNYNFINDIKVETFNNFRYNRNNNKLTIGFNYRFW